MTLEIGQGGSEGSTPCDTEWPKELEDELEDELKEFLEAQKVDESGAHQRTPLHCIIGLRHSRHLCSV